MRVFVFLLASIILLSCEDKQSNKKKNIEPSKTKVDKHTVVKDTAKPKTKTFPKLNDKNAMEFFLEYDKHNKENKVRLTTDFGTIDILLFNETKFHRSNFIYLTKRNYFNGTQFYRVVKNFVIQGGGGDDIAVADNRRAIGYYLLPPDTKRGFKHDRGTVSMPSSEIENPHKLASPFEFFIVQQQGGAHHLDGDYTVFGKVTKGMDVVDKIANVKTDGSEWPVLNVYIRKVEIID